MTDYSVKTDERLVALCRKDDPEAWKELCLRYSLVSRTVSLKFKSSGVETDDLTQEGLLGFLSAVHSYKEDKGVTFKTYAWTCIRNKIINAVRSKGNMIDECQSLNFIGDVADVSLTPEERLVSESSAKAIAEVINGKLSSKEKKVLSLYLEGRTYEEIGNFLSMSIKSVDGSLQRARKKLRAELDAQ